jgi:hypothetical protein
MELLGSHWTGFDETWYLRLFRKSIEKTQILLKSDANNEYLTWRRFDIFHDISLNAFRMRNVLNKRCRENQTHILYSVFFFENLIVYEIMSKNWLETEGPQMTSEHGACALHAGLARLNARMLMHTPTRPVTHMHARTHRPVCNTYCFCTTTMLSWTRLSVTLCVHCLYFFLSLIEYW